LSNEQQGFFGIISQEAKPWNPEPSRRYLTLWDMEIIVNVPADRAAFALEVLRNLVFVESARPRRVAKAKQVEQDTTEYLLSNPANAAFIFESIAQLRRGETVSVDIPQP